MAVRPRHVNHRSLERLRHSDRFRSWIASQAARLEVDEGELFETLKSFTFEQINNMEPEPEPEPEEEE